MKVLTVQSLDGIKPAFQQEVYEAMLSCTNRERLLVCLYFMSELPTHQLDLANIEANLRRIFPRSRKGKGKLPDEYADFQASAVRHLFDKEVMNGVDPGERLWENVGLGRWRNTALGNERAVQVLRRLGIQVDVQGHEPAPVVPQAVVEPVHVPEETEPEDGDASQPEELMDTEAEEAHDAIQQVEAESLLVYVDKLLGCLPDIDPHRLEEPDATTLAIEGSPQEVQGVIHSMMGFAKPGQVSLRSTLSREGWHVALDVHS